MKCLVLVTDKTFLLGTFLTLYSILKHNPWFVGQVIVVEQDLSVDMKELLSSLIDITFVKPSDELNQRATLVSKILPSYSNSNRKFHSIEAFKYSNYNQLLYLDSDLLCLGDISKLFEYTESPIVVAGDRSHYRNKKRNSTDFLSTSLTDEKKDQEYLDCFNSGMILINASKLPDGTYNSLLSLVSPIVFEKVRSGHADQYILNRIFKDEHLKVSAAYNYLTHSRASIYEKEKIGIDDSLLIHYIKQPKPWDKNSDLNDPAIKIWRNLHLEYIDLIKKKSSHLLSVFLRLHEFRL